MIYNLSLELPDTFHYVIYDRITAEPLPENRVSTPKLVCKQFWFETSQVLLASATFQFTEPKFFRALAISAPRWLQCVRRIFLIPSDGWYASDLLKWWAGSLTSSLVGRFTHLEGVRFEVYVYDLGGLCAQLDVMTDRKWKKTKLPSIIRSLQQHKLKPALTTFKFKVWKTDRKSFGFLEDPAISEAIRTELLKYRPRRVSKRGKGDDEDNI